MSSDLRILWPNTWTRSFTLSDLFLADQENSECIARHSGTCLCSSILEVEAGGFRVQGYLKVITTLRSAWATWRNEAGSVESMSYERKAFDWEQRANFLLSSLYLIPRKLISLLVWSLDKENPRLGISKEEEGNRKEGRELLDFLARFQKQIFAEPGIVRPASVQAQEDRQGTLVLLTWLHTLLLRRNWCVNRALEGSRET